MKYLLRIVVVIIIIAAIVFGVVQCNNKKSNEDLLIINAVEHMSLSNESVSSAESVINIDNEKINFVHKSSLSDYKQMIYNSKEKLKSFIGELYFATNINAEKVSAIISNVDVLKEQMYSLKNQYDSILQKSNNLSISEEVLNRYVFNYVKTYEKFTKLYLTVSLNITEYIKEMVYNNSTNNNKLNETINYFTTQLENGLLQGA